VGKEVGIGGLDRCDEGGGPLVQGLRMGGVEVVVNIGGEKVLEGGLGTGGEELEFGVVVMEGAEFGEVAGIGGGGVVEVVLGKGR
jgi:hypothetical protein